jgi:hypothetical protein
MCEVLNADANPHESNGRATIEVTIMIFGLGLNRNIFYGILKPISL